MRERICTGKGGVGVDKSEAEAGKKDRREEGSGQK